MKDAKSFLHSLASHGVSVADRAVYLIWWHGQDDPDTARTPKELCDEIDAAGYARPNVTTLKVALEADGRTAKKGGGFKIKVDKRAGVSQAVGSLVAGVPPPASNSILDISLLSKARKYNTEVAAQINAAYDTRLFDCSAVMCRRLVESLIIDAYEAAKVEDELKGSDGNFLMLKGLLQQIEKKNTLSVSRSAISGLKTMKALGDLSAHSRRYLARQTLTTRRRT